MGGHEAEHEAGGDGHIGMGKCEHEHMLKARHKVQRARRMWHGAFEWSTEVEVRCCVFARVHGFEMRRSSHLMASRRIRRPKEAGAQDSAISLLNNYYSC